MTESTEASASSAPGEALITSRPPAKKYSYLRRHWRGDLPLAVSYWVNGFAGSPASAPKHGRTLVENLGGIGRDAGA